MHYWGPSSCAKRYAALLGECSLCHMESWPGHDLSGSKDGPSFAFGLCHDSMPRETRPHALAVQNRTGTGILREVGVEVDYSLFSQVAWLLGKLSD
jgi:hypothetical protein